MRQLPPDSPAAPEFRGRSRRVWVATGKKPAGPEVFRHGMRPASPPRAVVTNMMSVKQAILTVARVTASNRAGARVRLWGRWLLARAARSVAKARALVVRWGGLGIVHRVLLGYLAVVLMSILIAVIVLSSLQRLNVVNESIIRRDVRLVDVADKMIDSLLAQELYARRYVILEAPGMLGLFWERSREFEALAREAARLPVAGDVPIQRINELHAQYTALVMQNIDQLAASPGQRNDREIRLRHVQEQLIALIKEVSHKARSEQNRKTLLIAEVGERAFRLTALLWAAGMLFAIGAAVVITRGISGAVSTLKRATEHVSEGRFDALPTVDSGDELGDLSRAFNSMAARLKLLEEMHLDASPLTHLPGGVAVENVLKHRIEQRRPFAFCMLDIDNFKALNDHYGYARGNELIKSTAQAIEAVVKKIGGGEDFVGHIGGDDFTVVTTPERGATVCREVITAFDQRAGDFYDPEDLQRGYIVGRSRQGNEERFPIVTLSIAVVTDDGGQLASHIQVGEIAAELKTFAKSKSGSNYVVDRRGPQGASRQRRASA